jgi:hypothetical protein
MKVNVSIVGPYQGHTGRAVVGRGGSGDRTMLSEFGTPGCHDFVMKVFMVLSTWFNESESGPCVARSQ